MSFYFFYKKNPQNRVSSSRLTTVQQYFINLTSKVNLNRFITQLITQRERERKHKKRG